MPGSISVFHEPHDVEDENKDKDGKHLWSSLLEEVTHKAAVTLSPSKTLVVLGDDECGKTTLIARLQGTEDPKKGFGLEYTLLDVKDEDRDDQTKLNVWILDGNPVHSHLLQFAINEESFGDCAVLLTVSMTEPWNIVQSLEKWVDILEKHINHLRLPPETLSAHKKTVLRQFCNYLEPDALSTTRVSSIPPTPITHVPEVPISNIQKKMSILHPATAALLSASINRVSVSSKPEVDNIEDRDQETILTPTEPPLDESILKSNLGIPLIVVVTKTDIMNTLEKEQRFNEEHFDFIQMHIRRFCLSYGAALFYLSVKEDKNCDLLNRYIQSRIYGFPFTQAAYVVERDCIFVPSGWDNEKKIGILEENLTQIKPQSLYHEVIPRPPPKKTTVREPEQLAQDEQSFLTRLSAILQRESAQPTAVGSVPSSGASDAVMEQLISAAALTSISPNHPGNVSGTAVRPNSGSPRTPANASRTKVATVGQTGGAGSTGSGASEGVLANFFNSLLNKRSPATNTSGNTSAAGTTTAQSDKIMSQKDIQSELERLARDSRDTIESTLLDATPKATEPLLDNLLDSDSDTKTQPPDHPSPVRGSRENSLTSAKTDSTSPKSATSSSKTEKSVKISAQQPKIPGSPKVMNPSTKKTTQDEKFVSPVESTPSGDSK